MVLYLFSLSRFLLICQLEGLDLSFTLKWFLSWNTLEHCLRNSSGNRVFGVFLRLDLHNDFHGFFFIYGLAISLVYLGYIFSQPCSPKSFFLKTILKDLFLFYLENKFYSYLFNLENDAFHNFNIFWRNHLKILFLFFRNII